MGEHMLEQNLSSRLAALKSHLCIVPGYSSPLPQHLHAPPLQPRTPAALSPQSLHSSFLFNPLYGITGTLHHVRRGLWTLALKSPPKENEEQEADNEVDEEEEEGGEEKEEEEGDGEEEDADEDEEAEAATGKWAANDDEDDIDTKKKTDEED
ncbi:Hypothetical predicted protein [Marmota monax]|uniref:Prothymosin alpha n=1 Tax=Marmota monax TaxID=9995 RepID=A0A5E4BC30_MARMO|nr:Hypothetical predicted protein [Marmota monax]